MVKADLKVIKGEQAHSDDEENTDDDEGFGHHTLLYVHNPAQFTVDTQNTLLSGGKAVAALPGKAAIVSQRLVAAAAQTARVLRQDLESRTHCAVPLRWAFTVQTGGVTRGTLWVIRVRRCLVEAEQTVGLTDASKKRISFVTRQTENSTFIGAGFAGRVAPPADHAVGLLVVPLGTALHTLPSVGDIEEVLPTAQAMGTPRTPAGITGRVTALTQHGGGVPKVTLGAGLDTGSSLTEVSRLTADTLQAVAACALLTAPVAALTHTLLTVLCVGPHGTLLYTCAVE